MDHSLENLQKIGMTNKEARVYLALLELGKSAVSVIAGRAQMNRSTAYVILRSLRAQGFVLEIPNTKKHEFIAEDPQKIVEITQSRHTLAERLVPTLQAKRKKESGLSNFRFYQGLDGLREAYQYRLESFSNSECVAFWGASASIPPEAHRIFLKWARDSKRANVRLRAIAPDDESLSLYRDIDTEHLREVRIVPQSVYPSELSIEIFTDMVRMTSLSDLQTVIIESKETARSMKAIFEMCWKQSVKQ